MPITGVFFIPSTPNSATAFATVTERLHSAVADEPLAIGRWALEHKLMRDTPSCLPGSTPQRSAQPRYMQFLSLSYYPNHGFIYTSPNPETPGLNGGNNSNATAPPGATQPAHPGTPNSAPAEGSGLVMATVPLPSCGTLFKHFVYACQPFWCHRHTVAVPGGTVYDVGDFRVRIGDVRQTQPAVRPRGTVVEIEWRGPSLVTSISTQYSQSRRGSSLSQTDSSAGDHDSAIDLAMFSSIEDTDVDAEYVATAALIREFWSKLGIDGAREAILVPDVGKEVKKQLRKLKQQEKGGDWSPTNDNGDMVRTDEDPDPDAGTDLARQFMEIFRFNR
ncbi:uncharacterized protein ACLA_049280 [Aspergillus clavatus NRRL 1]|uniref:Mediator of RNA polymerase II transcription subunit 20 n=1 Tax=Aspergillus clavatus (strain ATCC 1007 / CBS 513.65 / DSM 816 / NCTC 3887 / NRRL 1 / QM 1276 / 107) TaxID=344612 RepID=A1CHV1_ASPCL|nr:uncharacterized protein ACLA_049280 [Aspergillus clavatus NRRL 1]EAW10456.1 conserved hypothetical protein [Aspergillus clavatus NRRL 1]